MGRAPGVCLGRCRPTSPPGWNSRHLFCPGDSSSERARTPRCACGAPTIGRAALRWVPAGMPVVTAAVLAVGAREMVRENAIVSRLSALEELSGMEVLCSGGLSLGFLNCCLAAFMWQGLLSGLSSSSSSSDDISSTALAVRIHMHAPAPCRQDGHSDAEQAVAGQG